MGNLKENVTKILEENDFDYCEYSGCFDIVARRDKILLLKLLGNIDSFQEEQATNLKILSNTLVATAFLIGFSTRRERLEDNVVYERFSIPAITTGTFESMLEGSMPFLYRFRGGLFVEIDPEKLRERRVSAGLTQDELASKVGVTKKSIYEHEKKKMGAEYEIAKRMEQFLGKVTAPLRLEMKFEEVKSFPRERFEFIVSRDLRSLGFETSFVYQTPFNILAEEDNFLIISEAEKNKKQIERNVTYIKGFSSVVRKPVLVVTKEELSIDVPSIEEKELKEISPKELKRLLRKW